MPAGVMGLLRAGLELSSQIAEGVLPSPDRLYVPLGSGGTTAGLALGLALAGHHPTIHAVSTVERVFISRKRLLKLIAQTRQWLAERGVEIPNVRLPEIKVDYRQVGPGYGHPTKHSEGACQRLEAEVALEPVYSGKAMSSLLAARHPGESVLFWVTPRRSATLPVDPDWRQKLPTALRRRLDRGRGPSRRLVIVAGAAALAWWRLGGYGDLPDWDGRRLYAWEVHVLLAAAEVLLPPAPLNQAFRGLPAAVDDFMLTLPEWLLREIHALFVTIEQGAPVLGCHWSRFTSLPSGKRVELLSDLDRRGGIPRMIYRSIRDLCMLGYYQHPSTWSALDYDGPTVPPGPRPDPYASLLASPGRVPEGFAVLDCPATGRTT